MVDGQSTNNMNFMKSEVQFGFPLLLYFIHSYFKSIRTSNSISQQQLLREKLSGNIEGSLEIEKLH